MIVISPKKPDRSISCDLSPFLTIVPVVSAPEEEPVRYRVETLALFVLGPVVVLALLSVVSVLACRRLHHGRLQRLQEFDTEQGAIDGLITSNVGDSTLAVRMKPSSQNKFNHEHQAFYSVTFSFI